MSHRIYGWEVALVPLRMPVRSGHKGLEGVRVGDSREPQGISAKGWKTSSRCRELKEGKTFQGKEEPDFAVGSGPRSWICCRIQTGKPPAEGKAGARLSHQGHIAMS